MSSLFRPEVLAKQRQRLDGTISLLRPVKLQWLSLLLALITVVSTLFIVSADYRRKQTVHGILQPVNGLIKVQVTGPGQIAELFVTEGQQVKAGDSLLRVTRPQFDNQEAELGSSRLAAASKNLLVLQERKRQLISLHQLAIKQAEEQLQSLALQQAQMQQQLATVQQRLILNQRQLTQLQKLSGSGYISELEITRQKDQLLSLSQQQKTLESEAEQTALRVQQAKSAKLQLPLQQQEQLAVLEAEMTSQNLLLLERSVEMNQLVKAPVSGQVGALQIKPGQMVQSEQQVLTLVPENPQLEAVAFLPSKSTAFVEVGQIARLRYHAYPYQRFGIFEGEIVEIGAAILLPEEVTEVRLMEPAFKIRIRIPAQQVTAYNRQFPMKAGMSFEADLITEQMSLWQWLFDPIYSLRGRL